MFSPGGVPEELPETLLDHWIDLLRTMIFSSESSDAKKCSGLQALSLWAGLSKQMSFFPSLPGLNPTQGDMRKKIVEKEMTSWLLKLFQSDNDAIKYCVSQALITLNGGSCFSFHIAAAHDSFR